MTFMRRILDALRMDNGVKEQMKPSDTNNPVTSNVTSQTPILESSFEQRVKIEGDFPYIPFLKHCSTAFNGTDKTIVTPNMSEQHQILYYIDSFNQSLADISDELDITDLHIYTESVNFRLSPPNWFPRTHISFSPYTKTGKKAKYPVSVFFTTEECDKEGRIILYQKDYELGYIDFMQDGNIGKARIIIWRNHVAHIVYYKLLGSSFIIDKVEKNDANGRIIIYKEK